MAEYFEREALIGDLTAAMDHRGMGQVIGQTLIRYVKRQPTADVVPVVHGRWEHGYYCYEPATQCSVCKVCLAKGHRAEKQFTYCPNCGAKMDGGADNA